jgi:hypothetical protein
MNTPPLTKALKLTGSLVTGMCLVIGMAAAATNPPPKTVTANATNNAPASANIVIATSQFAIPTTAAQGRDPFFPLSSRTAVSANTNRTNVKAATAKLVLQGISGTQAKRFALISRRTFESGEEGEVTVDRTKYHVRCLSIKEDSAIIEVDGQQQELKLRPGI